MSFPEGNVRLLFIILQPLSQVGVSFSQLIFLAKNMFTGISKKPPLNTCLPTSLSITETHQGVSAQRPASFANEAQAEHLPEHWRRGGRGVQRCPASFTWPDPHSLVSTGAVVSTQSTHSDASSESPPQIGTQCGSPPGSWNLMSSSSAPLGLSWPCHSTSPHPPPEPPNPSAVLYIFG